MEDNLERKYQLVLFYHNLVLRKKWKKFKVNLPFFLKKNFLLFLEISFCLLKQMKNFCEAFDRNSPSKTLVVFLAQHSFSRKPRKHWLSIKISLGCRWRSKVRTNRLTLSRLCLDVELPGYKVLSQNIYRFTESVKTFEKLISLVY